MGYALEGQTITSWTLDRDSDTLVFHTADNKVIEWETIGDCCSSTWFESIEGQECLTGYVVSVEDIELPDIPAREIAAAVARRLTGQFDYGEHIQYYGIRINTTRGTVIIDYRNSSNGYYGGWITENVRD